MYKVFFFFILFFSNLLQASDETVVISTYQNAIQAIDNIFAPGQTCPGFVRRRLDICTTFVNEDNNFLGNLLQNENKIINNIKERLHKNYSCGEVKKKDSLEEYQKQTLFVLQNEIYECVNGLTFDHPREGGPKEHQQNKLNEENINKRKSALKAMVSKIKTNIEEDEAPFYQILNSELEYLSYLINRADFMQQGPKTRLSLLSLSNHLDRKISQFDISMLVLSDEHEEANTISTKSQEILQGWNELRMDMISSGNQIKNSFLAEFLIVTKDLIRRSVGKGNKKAKIGISTLESILKSKLGVDAVNQLSPQGQQLYVEILEDLEKNNGINIFSSNGHGPDFQPQLNLPTIILDQKHGLILSKNNNSTVEPSSEIDPSKSLSKKIDRFISENMDSENKIISFFNNNPKKFIQLFEEELELLNSIKPQWLVKTKKSNQANEDEQKYSHKPHEVLCKNIPPQCAGVYEQFLTNIANIIHVGESYENKENNNNLNKLYADSKKATAKYVSNSSFSRGSKKAILKSLNSTGELESYENNLIEVKNSLLHFGKTYAWLKKNNKNLAHLDLKDITNDILSDIPNYTSMRDFYMRQGINAKYDPANNKVSINTGFASEYALTNHKGKIASILLHEIGHSIDPTVNSRIAKEFSEESKSKRDNLFQCLERKFQRGRFRVNENYGDLIANDILLGANLKDGETNPLSFNELEKRQLLRDNLLNSCQSKTTFLDNHSPSREREDQFFSHPKFNTFLITNATSEVEHGVDCGQIIR